MGLCWRSRAPHWGAEEAAPFPIEFLLDMWLGAFSSACGAVCFPVRFILEVLKGAGTWLGLEARGEHSPAVCCLSEQEGGGLAMALCPPPPIWSTDGLC